MDTNNNQLKESRDRIDDIDSGIIDLLARRQIEVERILEYKKKNSLPVYNPAREEDMISRLRILGREKNLDPDFLEELFRIIIGRSRVEQNDSRSKTGVRPGTKVLVVGGTRGMGKYFAERLKDSGYETRVMGSRDWDRVKDLCKGIDLALISVPIDSTVEVIEKISAFLPEKAVLADLTSVKKEPLKAMMTFHRGPVAGIHPVFGPSSSGMDKQIIAVTQGRDMNECQWLMDQLSQWGAIVVYSDAEEHDRIMAVVQALRHFATFAFGRFLFENKTDLFRTLEFSSPIYRLELGMVGRLFAQGPDLYSGIIFASSDRKDILKKYIFSMSELMDMVGKGDKKEFTRQTMKCPLNGTT